MAKAFSSSAVRGGIAFAPPAVLLASLLQAGAFCFVTLAKSLYFLSA